MAVPRPASCLDTLGSHHGYHQHSRPVHSYSHTHMHDERRPEPRSMDWALLYYGEDPDHILLIQESLLNGIYIWKTTSILRAEAPLFKSYENMRGGKGRKVQFG
jgi:hypothetical protein